MKGSDGRRIELNGNFRFSGKSLTHVVIQRLDIFHKLRNEHLYKFNFSYLSLFYVIIYGYMYYLR